MNVEKKKTKAIFRIDVRDFNSGKMKGFNIYGDGKNISLIKFVDNLKNKIKEM